MRKDSARITFNLSNAPFKITARAINQAIAESFKGIALVVKARQNSELDSKGRPMRSVMGDKPFIHARIATTGGRIRLPRVVVIEGPGGRTHPVRYKTDEGYFEVCGVCHQGKCECSAVKADMEKSLALTAEARAKQKERTKGKQTEGPPAPQRSMRDELVARRGEKGKAAVACGTEAQAATLC